MTTSTTTPAETAAVTATPAIHTKARTRRVPAKGPQTTQSAAVQFEDATTAQAPENNLTPAPVPRKPRPPKTDGKKSKITIESHFVPGKAAMATMTPDKLKELAFISTYSTRDDQSTSPRLNGYQREPMIERFPGIGRYYARDNNRHLITPIIVSVRVYTPQDQGRFNTLFGKGDMATIHKEFGKSVFSIVDGQHRMGGLYWAWMNLEDFTADVPLMLFYGLHYTEEANLFDDINTSQRKLPKALIEATKVHMEAGVKSHDQFIREIAFALAQDGDSVWQGLVNMTGGKEEPKPPVSFEGVRRSTNNMLNDQLVTRLQARKMDVAEVAKRYWQMVSKACYVAWNETPRETIDDEGYIGEEEVQYRLKDLVGLASLSKLGANILSTSLEKGHTDEDFWSSVADLTSKLSQVDWEKRTDNIWMTSTAGFAGVPVLYKMLYALVYLDLAPGDAVEESG